MATSGSYDLFATLFFLLSAVLLLELVRAPQAPENLGLLLTTLLIFSHVRNESVIVLPVFVAGLLAWRCVSWRQMVPWALVIGLFWLPIGWQRILMQGHYEAPKDVALLSPMHLAKNLPIFLHTFVDFNFRLPYATAVHLLAVLIFLFVGALLVRRRLSFRAPYQKHFCILVGTAFILTMLVYLCHFFGELDKPTQVRWMLLWAIFSALSLLLLRAVRPSWISGGHLFVIALALFALYHPVAVANELMKEQVLPRQVSYCLDFLKARPHRENLLVIDDRPGQLTAADYGAVSFGYANQHAEDLLGDLNQGLFAEILVFQKVEYADDQAKKGQRLETPWKLEILDEAQMEGDAFLRISQVVLPEVESR